MVPVAFAGPREKAQDDPSKNRSVESVSGEDKTWTGTEVGNADPLPLDRRCTQYGCVVRRRRC